MANITPPLVNTPPMVKKGTYRHFIADRLGIQVWDVKPEHYALMDFCREHGLIPEASKMMNDIAVAQGLRIMQVVVAFDDYWSNPEII